MLPNSESYQCPIAFVNVYSSKELLHGFSGAVIRFIM